MTLEKLVAKKKPARKTTRAKTAKKPAKKPVKKAKSRKPAFGGYAIDFSGRKETVEQVFGRKPIPPSQMTKKIWAFVKAKNLSNK